MTNVDNLRKRLRGGPDIDLISGEVVFGVRVSGERYRPCCRGYRANPEEQRGSNQDP